ncbi:mannitol-1-phosphate 5-dehydrogenase [bacterium]|nr:mannitol-1-phosphate 5-dehydrogenase [bacterium]
METFVQIGAGNIGRSFIGQLFSRAGFEVIFLDVVEDVIAALNRERRYRVEIKDRVPETIWVEHVRGVNSRDVAAAARALADCRCCGTAVGPKALPFVIPTLAEGLRLRHAEGKPPLDVIICENMREAAAAVRAGLVQHLPPGFPLDDVVGLVETSIGKMVPIMSAEDRAADPLLVFAEAYNTLICDAAAFKNPVPDVRGLDPKQNMKAYVDRKSFIHNFGHALCAYLGYLQDPSLTTTWQAVEHPVVGPAVRAGMWESGRALMEVYPEEFNEQNQGAHIEDLISRFANRALGDTLHRVGRDLQRKLSREDRVIGPLLMDLREGVEPEYTALCAAAGMHFRAPDEQGELFPADREFLDTMAPRGVEWVLSHVCGLDAAEPLDAQARALITAAEKRIRQAQADGRAVLD